MKLTRNLTFLICLFFSSISYGESIADISFTTENSPPYNYLKNGKLEGMAVDILKKMVKEIEGNENNLKVKVLPWAVGYRNILQKSNTSLFSMAKLKSRASLFKWVGPIFNAKKIILAKKSKKIKISSLKELANFSVGTIKEDSSEHILINRGVDVDLLDRSNSTKELVNKLINGKNDLIAYDNYIVKWVLVELGEKLSEYEVIYGLGEGQHYYAFNKSISDKMIGKMQKSLDKIKSKSEYKKILDKYLGSKK